MRRVRQRDTDIEVRLRSVLHRRGLRFFVDRAPIAGMRSRADIVFPRARVAVYVDGCFWHGCPEHGTWPKSNEAWWREKLKANERRDRACDESLADAGWVSCRVWAHEEPEQAANRIAEFVRARATGAHSAAPFR